MLGRSPSPGTRKWGAARGPVSVGGWLRGRALFCPGPKADRRGRRVGGGGGWRVRRDRAASGRPTHRGPKLGGRGPQTRRASARRRCARARRTWLPRGVSRVLRTLRPSRLAKISAPDRKDGPGGCSPEAPIPTHSEKRTKKQGTAAQRKEQVTSPKTDLKATEICEPPDRTFPMALDSVLMNRERGEANRVTSRNDAPLKRNLHKEAKNRDEETRGIAEPGTRPGPRSSRGRATGWQGDAATPKPRRSE